MKWVLPFLRFLKGGDQAHQVPGEPQCGPDPSALPHSWAVALGLKKVLVEEEVVGGFSGT